jgi:hypothetical protein
VAKPGELAELIAELFDADIATVRQQARVLRDHGYMQKERGGRGPGSMSARDAASLLVAAAGTASVKQSAAILDEPGQYRSANDPWRLPFLPLPELVSLPADHTLADAVASLIESAVNGSLKRAAEAAYGGQVDLARDTDPGLLIEVVLIGPIASARIAIALIEDDDDGSRGISRVDREVRVYGLKRSGSGNISHLPQPGYEKYQRDLRSEQTFTHRSIMRVAELLRGDATP